MVRKPDQCRIAARDTRRSCVRGEEIEQRPWAAGDNRVPGHVLDPEGKESVRVGTHVVKSPLAVSLQAIAWGHPASLAIEDIEQPVSTGKNANSFFEMEEPGHQQSLPVIGHCGEPVVNLIAKHEAGAIESDRDQGAGRERDQDPHKESQLEHDRSPGSQARSLEGGIEAWVEMVVHQDARGPETW